MLEQKENAAPIKQSVVVDCPIEEAFELFTERRDEWWPPSHSMEWGEIVEWDPPNRASFRNGDQTMDVEFRVVADGTRVTVIHTGWQNAGAQMMACAAMKSYGRFVSEMLVIA